MRRCWCLCRYTPCSTYPTLLSGLDISVGHARELLFGFALAVVVGYLLGPITLRRLTALFILWLGARLGYLITPSSLLPALLRSAFAIAPGSLIAPRFRLKIEPSNSHKLAYRLGMKYWRHEK